jgi:tripartite-type tricarboxylate transporter receptor subunit TctC
MTERLTRRAALAGSLAALATPAMVAAQAPWPTRPINMVNPFAPGGYTDRLARAYAPFMERVLGRPIVQVSRPGANGVLGHTYFLQQPDDGHTVLVSALAPFVIINGMFQGARYRPEDFDILNTPARDFTLMATSANNQVLTDIQVVAARLRADPRALSFGVQAASADFVNLALWLQAIGVERSRVRIVTYDGGGPVRNATAGGVVDIGLVGGEGFLPIRQMIRPLLVFEAQRREPYAAPTFREAFNVDEFVAGSQRGFAVHATLRQKHPDRYERLLAAVKAVSDDPAAVEALARQELETTWYGPEESNASFRRVRAVMETHAALLRPA